MDDDFDLFWKPYPKKVGKVKTRIVWNKKAAKGEIPEINCVLSKLNKQIAYKALCKQKGVFCSEWPDPERYIKYERWEDEVINEADQRDTKLSPAQRAAQARLGEGGGAPIIDGECASQTQYRFALGANVKH